MGRRKDEHPVRNEAMNLYETDVDDLLRQQGYLVIDSSLGVMRDDPDPSSGPHVASPIDK
jgi:hypothetical protein